MWLIQGVPSGETHWTQPEGTGGSAPGGGKASGGSHSSAAGCCGCSSGGIAATLSSGAVEVAPDALYFADRAARADVPGRIEQARVRRADSPLRLYSTFFGYIPPWLYSTSQTAI